MEIGLKEVNVLKRLVDFLLILGALAGQQWIPPNGRGKLLNQKLRI
jgi:hypothetical protein